ncbi:MAG: PAS domain S-box protein [Gemmatimonadota bacterium]
MAAADDEDIRMRTAGLQNALSILQARQRAEAELLAAKESLEKRTAELAGSLAVMRATLEATTDGILMTDGAGHVLGFNEKFIRMWRLHDVVLDDIDHHRLITMLEPNFADPTTFRRRVEEIYRTSPAEAFDLLELADGRVFERFSSIQVVDGEAIGRVWSLRDITAHRNTEAELGRKSEWLRITLSSIGDGVVTTDNAGVVTSLNPVAERLTGWTQADGVGVPLTQLFNIVNEATRVPVENPALRALREGRVVELANHTVLISRDGSERAIDDSAAPIADGQGTVQGAVLIFRDVTERRQAEGAVIRLAAVVDFSDDAIISKSLDGIIATWNRGAERIFGYTQDEVVGRPITIILPPERYHEEDEILRRLRRGERLDHFETVRIHKDGHSIDVSVTVSPIRDAEGRIIGASKISRDITQRKRNERTTRFLAESSAALAELGDIESTLQRVAGMAVPAFADLCAVDLVAPDGSPRRISFRYSEGIDPAAARGMARYGARSNENHNVSRVIHSGQPIWIESLTDENLQQISRSPEHLALLRRLAIKSYICTPLLSRSRVLGVLSFATGRSGRMYDATDLAVAEDLADRTVIAIENANLVSALQESDQRKDEFLAILAHELRNPLAPIRNSVQVLRGKAPPIPEVQWAADVIDRQVSQMTRLVDDLLDISRITSGKVQLRRELLALATAVQSAVDGSRPLIDSARHEFTVRMPAEPVYLMADLTRLSQVILNLLNNAAKYTNPGGRIWLTVEAKGAQVEIRVKDTGIGIDAGMLPRIFDMFTQDDRSLERSQGGLGIGLTLVRQLVEMHGGTVRASSAGAGQGSEFVVTLPVEQGATAPGPAEPDTGVAAASSRRILVVDDNRDSADSLSMLLGMLGNDVRAVHDGLDAVRVAGEFRPEIILLDIGLPKLNGYDAAIRIRQLLGRSVVLVALTGWGQQADRRRSRDAGFDHHMTKPVDVEALRRLVAGEPPAP